jgi:biopolymer transport protein ExbD
MADIITPQTNRKKAPGVRKMKKASIRIDLTPMVDLGFLLITFFIFTTSLSQAKAMDLVLPTDVPDSIDEMEVKESGVITILLGGNSSIYYYEKKLSKDGANLHTATQHALRDKIIHKKKHTKPEDLFVIIKPGKESVYKDVVNVLDEMTINDIQRYAIADLSKTEETEMSKIK